MSDLNEVFVTVKVPIYDHEMSSEEETERQIRELLNQGVYNLVDYEY